MPKLDGVTDASPVGANDVHSQQIMPAEARAVVARTGPTHPQLGALEKKESTGPHVTAASAFVSKAPLEKLPSEILSEIAQYGPTALKLSGASKFLRRVFGKQALFYLAETLDEVKEPDSKQQICDYILDHLSTVEEDWKHVVAGNLVRHFHLIPASSEREASAARLWDASLNLPEAHRGNVISHLRLEWLPAAHREGALYDLIDSAAPLYQKKPNQEKPIMPTYDALYRPGGKPAHRKPPITPLWSAKTQVCMLPADKRDPIRARIRELEGEVTQAVERLFPRGGDVDFDAAVGVNTGSGRYAKDLLTRGFTPHEAGYLAGVSDIDYLAQATVLRVAESWRSKNGIVTLSDFVRAHQERRVPR